jgi:succinate dehydrogenase / fumarate reductase membrane anchor subunit
MAARQIRSSFKRAHGLGSAREGVGHWWMQRLTAIALLPLTLWFATSLITSARSDYDAFTSWLRAPLTAVLMPLFLIALFYHMALGLQVVVEEYVHTHRIKMPIVAMIHLGCFALTVAGIVATLRIAFDG